MGEAALAVRRDQGKTAEALRELQGEAANAVQSDVGRTTEALGALRGCAANAVQSDAGKTTELLQREKEATAEVLRRDREAAPTVDPATTVGSVRVDRLSKRLSERVGLSKGPAGFDPYNMNGSGPNDGRLDNIGKDHAECCGVQCSLCSLQ